MMALWCPLGIKEKIARLGDSTGSEDSCCYYSVLPHCHRYAVKTEDLSSDHALTFLIVQILK